MGYRSDVYICIEKEDLPKVIFESFVDYCEVKQLEGDLVLFLGKDLKLYATDEWNKCKSTIEELETYHWITIGEDGAVEEDYSIALLDVETRVVTPKSRGNLEFNTDTSKAPSLSELCNFISLVLSKNIRVDYTTPTHCNLQYNYATLNNTKWFRTECSLIVFNGDTHVQVFNDNPDNEEIISKLKAQYRLEPVVKEGEAIYTSYKVYFK